MKRVLHFMSSISKGAGIANVIMTYYRNIDRSQVNFDFLIYYHTDSDFDEEIHNYGGNVYLIPKPGIRSVVKYIKELDEFFKTHQGEFQAVHLHEMYMNAIVFPIAKKHGIKCCIAHSHTTMYSDKLLSRIRNWIMFLPLKKTATDYFSCGIKAGEFAFGKNCVHEEKCYVLKNALNLTKYSFDRETYNEVRDEFNISCDDLVIGHVGRFEAQKNHEFLINVFKELHSRSPKSKLMLVGSGTGFERIKKMTETSGLSNSVIFTGNRSDVPRLLNAMDIFVLPSLFEGLPIVAIEAQASGLPCVISKTVTNEVSIGNVVYRDINGKNAVNIWCDTILSTKINDEKIRLEYNRMVKDSGYDIFVESKRLVEKYMKLFSR